MSEFNGWGMSEPTAMTVDRPDDYREEAEDGDDSHLGPDPEPQHEHEDRSQHDRRGALRRDQEG